MINWCMSSRREVLIIILVLLQRSLKSHIKMLKTALFNCAINVKCCSVDGGRTLFSSPPWGIWQLNSPHHWVFTIQGTKNANSRDQPELVHVIRWLRGEVLHEFQPSLSYRMNVVWPNQFQLNSRYLCISQFQLRPAPQADPWALAFFVPWMANNFPGVGTLELLSCQIPQHFSLIAQEESGWKEILELPGRQGGRLERLGRKMNTIQVSVRTCKWC